MNSKQAKSIPIQNFLDRLGFKPTKIKNADLWYFSPLRKEKTPSFKVNSNLNTWFDHGNNIGGTIIDFTIEYFKTNISGALKIIENTFPGVHPSPLIEVKKNDLNKKTKIQTIQTLSYFPLINYLKERKINIEIAKQYLLEIFYTFENKNYFTIAFKNNSNGYETRNSIFKGSFAPKDITTFNEQQNNIICIFEGFIDFLSYLTLFNIKTLKNTFIILNSVNQQNKAIEKIKDLKPIKLYFFLDHDLPGEETKKGILKQTKIKGISKNNLYAGYKDFNAFLMSKK